MSNRNSLSPSINPLKSIVNAEIAAAEALELSEDNALSIDTLFVVDLRASDVEPFIRHFCITNGNVLTSGWSLTSRCLVRKTGSWTKIRFSQAVSGTMTFIAGVIYDSSGNLIAKTANQFLLQGNNVVFTVPLLDPITLNPKTINASQFDVLYCGIAIAFSAGSPAFHSVNLKFAGFANAGINPSGMSAANFDATTPANIVLPTNNCFQLPWCALIP